jgi:hypothetical protein
MLVEPTIRPASVVGAVPVEHRAALARELDNAADPAELRDDLDIETLLDCIVGAYLAERARRGTVEPGWTQRVLHCLRPAFTEQLPKRRTS